MSAISDNLIHFLARNDKQSPGEQFKIFTKIIENGLRTSPISIKFSDGARVFNQVICFTDIPLQECNEHTSNYGKFGIGFKKAYVKNVGGNPARYFVDYMPGSTGVSKPGNWESRGGLYMNLCHVHKVMMKINQREKSDP